MRCGTRRCGWPAPSPALEIAGPEPDLVRAVESRDPSLAAQVGARLIGRGGGLTPEGDDLVAGVVAVIAVGTWPGALRRGMGGCSDRW